MWLAFWGSSLSLHMYFVGNHLLHGYVSIIMWQKFVGLKKLYKARQPS